MAGKTTGRYINQPDRGDLVDVNELDGSASIQIADPRAPGGVRKQTWHFPRRTECTVCHNMAAKYVLGVTTHQMNRSYNHGGDTLNQIEMLHRLDLNNDGYLDIFIANDHDKVEGADILVYWGRKNGPSSLLPQVAEHLPTYRLLDEIENRRNAALRLPSEGGGRATLTDLNGDGVPDFMLPRMKFMTNQFRSVQGKN